MIVQCELICVSLILNIQVLQFSINMLYYVYSSSVYNNQNI